MDTNTLLIKLNDDSIQNEELHVCLESKNPSIVGKSILKIIERKYIDDVIVELLTKISLLIGGYKAVGPYEFGHLAIAALFLVNNSSALNSFDIAYSTLKEDDKFLVDNFIKSYGNKL
ncbi:MAG: hypothetical protein LBV33_06070 [Lachnospiraceae bacterium]|nr:hypothetical protein [Lachnospiraceae bacterium]